MTSSPPCLLSFFKVDSPVLLLHNPLPGRALNLLPPRLLSACILNSTALFTLPPRFQPSSRRPSLPGERLRPRFRLLVPPSPAAHHGAGLPSVPVGQKTQSSRGKGRGLPGVTSHSALERRPKMVEKQGKHYICSSFNQVVYSL